MFTVQFHETSANILFTVISPVIVCGGSYIILLNFCLFFSKILKYTSGFFHTDYRKRNKMIKLSVEH